MTFNCPTAFIYQPFSKKSLQGYFHEHGWTDRQTDKGHSYNPHLPFTEGDCMLLQGLGHTEYFVHIAYTKRIEQALLFYYPVDLKAPADPEGTGSLDPPPPP